MFVFHLNMSKHYLNNINKLKIYINKSINWCEQMRIPELLINKIEKYNQSHF